MNFFTMPTGIIMKRTRTVLLASTVFLGAVGAAFAEEVKPAILYDLGGKFDRSFNENAYDGASRFAKETGLTLMEFEPQNETQREQALRTFAEQGADPIIAVGFSYGPVLEAVAPEFPDTRFVLVDAAVDLPNVQSLQFAYDEGSFVVGALAGLKTQTDTVGFVGGMDIPIIRQFACAYAAGVHYVNADATVIENMTGTTPAAWADPTRGRELTLGQFEQGADIVHGAAGGTTMGVLQAAADAGKLAIGVGTNQNGIQPGHVLTTNTASLDSAVYGAFKAAADGSWQPGAKVLGIADGGVGWVLDEHNRSLVPAEDEARMDEIMQGIVAGEIEVPNYLELGNCPEN